MSATNQKSTTSSTPSSATNASGSGGRSNRRPNPFGPGKSNNQSDRKDNKQPSKGGAIPKDVTKVVPEDEADNGDNSCVVCFKVVAIYSVGECDHPVCYECSTRMRVLCEQNECPICRANLSKVIFSPEVLSYRQLEIKNRTGLYDKKYRICFATPLCQESYNKLLEHPCSMCSLGPFATFAALRDHVKKKHEQFYCDICTENLSVFSCERRSYTRTDLGIHRRKGDVDDKSHRGHPLCEYCDLRYFDRDELFKHLRREHFYCHFCDADGANCYYADYAALRVHFKSEHYLCEEGECAEEQFTAVFRTEIDLRAHNVSMHGQGLSRQAAKQSRTLELEIHLAPRSRNGQTEESGGRGFSSTYRHRDTQNEFDTPEQRQRQETVNPSAPQTRIIDARNEQEFPSLGGAAATTTTFTLRPSGPLMPRSYGTGGIARTQENFPALGGGASVTPSTSGSYRQGPASAILKNPGNKTVIHVSNRPNPPKKPEPKSAQDFPSLSGAASTKGKKSSSLFLDEDFVPLPSSSYTANIASKHRSLSNGYEAFAADATAKLGMVKLAQESQHVPKRPIDTAPKLSSSHMFPTLGNAPSAAMAAQWVSLGKRAPVESRKSKVAPAPLTTASSSSSLKTAVKPTVAVASTYKKEQTKPKPTEKPNSAPAAVAKNQKKVKNYNPFEDDSDEDVYVPSAAVMTAMSAKHRSLVDSYEAVVKPTTNKLALVSRPDPVTTAPNTKQVNAPKLNSKDNFPSLSGSSGSHAKSGPSINFLEIMKASNGSGDVQNNNGKKATNVTNNNNNDGRVGNLNGPPPGFSSAGTAPPPGFKSVTLNSVAKSSNDLTFTTSLGEQFSILPASSTQYQYLSPNNSAKRNQSLFANFQSIISDQQVVDSFKQVSQMYINGAYKAQPYYEHCQAALGDKFDVIFPELLVLLPDINKQQQLYQVHCLQAPKPAGGAKSKPKKQNNTSLEVCATCRQVLNSNDLQSHLQSHALANNFPSLSTNSSSSVTSSAWKNAGCAPVADLKVNAVAAADHGPRSSKPKAKTKSSGKQLPAAIASSQMSNLNNDLELKQQQHFSSLTLIGGISLAGLLLCTGFSAVWRNFA